MPYRLNPKCCTPLASATDQAKQWEKLAARPRSLRIKALEPDASNRKIAKALGINEKTVRNDRADKSASGQKKPNQINSPKGPSAEKSAPASVSGAKAAQIVMPA